MRISVGLGFAFASALLACGGGDSTGPVSMDTAQDGCAADCQHRIECGSTTPLAECTAECVASVTGVIREDVFNDVVDCSTQLACGASNDACEALCTPTAAHDRYEAACRGVFATCLDPAELASLCSVRPTGSGDAGFFCYVTPSIIDEFTACLPAGAACGTASTCLQNVATAHHIDI